MFRHGAGSAVDRIRRLYPGGLEASEEARSALDYLDKRMNGYCISSSHVEAAVQAFGRNKRPRKRASFRHR